MKLSNEERNVRLIRVSETHVQENEERLCKEVVVPQHNEEPPEKKSRKTANKENKIRKAVIKTNTKSKASKKLVLVPGQKTLKQFFM